MSSARDDLLVGQLEVLELIGLVAGQLALAHEQHLRLDEAALAVEAEDVLIAAPVRHRLLALLRLLDRAQPVAQPRRLLEALGLRRRAPSARRSCADQLDLLARQQQHRLAQMRLVLGAVDRQTAGAEAALDLVLEARPRAVAEHARRCRCAAG